MSTRPMLDQGVIRGYRESRIHAATFACVARNGYRATSVTDIVRTTGIARNTFYETFSGKLEAFRSAFAAAVAEVTERLEDAETLKDAVRVLRDYLAEEPDAAKSLLVEAVMVDLPMFEAAQAEATRRVGLEEPLAAMVVGGVVHILAGYVTKGEPVDVEALQRFLEPHFAGRMALTA